MHHARDDEHGGVFDLADAGNLVHRGLRCEEVLSLEGDTARAEDFFLLVIPSLWGNRDCPLAILDDIAEVRVGCRNPERHRADPSADVDDNGVLREADPRERCTKMPYKQL